MVVLRAPASGSMAMRSLSTGSACRASKKSTAVASQTKGGIQASGRSRVVDKASVIEKAHRVLRRSGSGPTLWPAQITGRLISAQANAAIIAAHTTRISARLVCIGRAGSFSSHALAAATPAKTVVNKGNAAGGSKAMTPNRSSKPSRKTNVRIPRTVSIATARRIG
jgi:hypothetical protein